MTQEKWLPGGSEPWFAQKGPSGPPGVWPHTHSPTQAQQGLPARSHAAPAGAGPGPVSAFTVCQLSAQHLGVRPEGNQSVSITCRGRKSMALSFLKSCRLRATARDRPAVSSHAGSLRERLVNTERCPPHTPGD